LLFHIVAYATLDKLFAVFLYIIFALLLLASVWYWGLKGSLCCMVCCSPVTHEPWSEDEQWRLQEGVRQFIGESRSSLKSFQHLPWTQVSTHVVTRTWAQCRVKWSVS